MSEATHVVATGGGRGCTLECLHCRNKLKIALPSNVSEFVAAGRSFVNRHKDCPAPAGKDFDGGPKKPVLNG